jgi:hypothetical protein
LRGKFFESFCPEGAGSPLLARRHQWGHSEMEPRVKSSRLIRDSEIAIDILELAAQSSEVVRHRRVIADSIVRAKVVTEGCFDERRFCGTGILGRFCQPRSHAFGEINANSGSHEDLARTQRPSFVVQTNHVSIGCFVIDLDGRIVSTRASTPSQVRNKLGSWKSATPAAALDGAQEVFDLGVECGWLFQIDRVAGIGADPQTRVGKGRFEHQVGFQAADILVAYGEQYRNCHFRELMAKIMQ